MGKPSHRFVAKDKKSGEYVQIGAVFKNEKGISLILQTGTKIQVVQGYDKAAKETVRFDKPKILSADTHYFNLFKVEDRSRDGIDEEEAESHPVTKAVKKTFKVDDSAQEPNF